MIIGKLFAIHDGNFNSFNNDKSIYKFDFFGSINSF